MTHKLPNCNFRTKCKICATSKTYTRTIDPNNEKPGLRKIWTLKIPYLEQPEVRKKWILKILDPEKSGP